MNDVDFAATLAEERHTQEHKVRRKTPVCYRCGSHFWGPHFYQLKSKQDGLERKFHRMCRDSELKESPELWEEVSDAEQG